VSDASISLIANFVIAYFDLYSVRK
jgi:hypothetical protein